MITYDPIQSACLKIDRMCNFLSIEKERCNKRLEEIELMKRLGMNSLNSTSIPIRKVKGVNI